MLQQTDAGGVVRSLAQVWQADANGAPRQLQQLWQADANGVARLVYAAGGSAGGGYTVTPDTATGTTASSDNHPAYTNAVTVNSPSGATILWTVPTGWTVSSQGMPTTSFKSPAIPAGGAISDSGSVKVTVGGMSQTVLFDLYASNQGAS